MQNNYVTALQSMLLSLLFISACTTNLHKETEAASITGMDRETADLAEVTRDAISLMEQTGKDKLLVVFDIDNTILAMEQGLGADQWYEWQKALGEEDECNPHYVGERFAVQGSLYFASAMRLTQQNGPDQVRAIQDTGIPVISLTSRGPDYRLQTFRELRRNGFSFTYSAIGPAGGYREAFVPVENGRLSRYEDGVFLTAGQHKGQMLLALLEKTGANLPAVIVMVDDKQKNLDAVKETFSVLNVPVHAWRYTAEDKNVSDFDPDKAAAQWQAIEASLRQIQQVLGPDNYDLSSTAPTSDCQ